MSAVDSKRSPAALAVRFAVIGGVLLLLGLNLPGHLSYDSVAQLREGRMGERQTWGPAAYAWILGALDHVFPGTGLYVTLSAVILGATLLLLLSLRPRTSWLAVPVVAAMMLSPQLLLYQGIVWKDVLFANCALAGFILLAHAARRWDARAERIIAVALAGLLFAVGSLVRQNGAIVIPLAAAALGWSARSGGWRRALGWGLGGAVVVFALIKGLGMAAEPASKGPDVAMDRGVRILQHYDIAGAVADDRTFRLDRLAAESPRYAAIMRKVAEKGYSPVRVDRMDVVPEARELWLASNAAVGSQWFEIVWRDPGAYLKHRTDAFIWLLASPDPELCLPAHVGISAPAPLLADLQMHEEVEPRDLSLLTYAEEWEHTPFFTHATYLVLAAAVLVATLLRREAADWVIAAMMTAAISFTMSFFVISIACDYRYLYFLDLAAMAGALYVALDPPAIRLGRGARGQPVPRYRASQARATSSRGRRPAMKR
jgi:hypothetical protein